MDFRFLCGKSWVLALVIFATSVVGGCSLAEKNADAAMAPAHLQGMTQVSPERFSMDAISATLCAAPVPGAHGPHENSAILVYVNDRLVEQIKTTSDARKLPVGTVILKEKYADLKTETAQLATIMRRTGNAGVVADWDFSAISLPDGEAVSMTANDKAACADCHAKFESRGFASGYTAELLALIGEKAKEEASAARSNAESTGSSATE